MVFFKSLVSLGFGLVLLRCDGIVHMASCKYTSVLSSVVVNDVFRFLGRDVTEFNQCRCSNLQLFTTILHLGPDISNMFLGPIIFFRIVSFKVNAVPGSLVFFKPGGLGAVLAGSIHTTNAPGLKVPVQVTRVKTRTQ